MKALILVGGYGTRLRPLTLTTPKPLVDFCNKPILFHQIEALAEVGVTTIVLAVSYMSNVLNEEVKKLEKMSHINIIVSQEKEPLGTAGPIALAKNFLTIDDEPIFILNSDIICSFPLGDMLNFHKAHNGSATIMVTKVSEPSKYGVIVMNENKRVESFVEKPAQFISNKINAGIYILDPSLLEIFECRPCSIEREIFPKIAINEQLYGFEQQDFWMDIGQPKDYLHGVKMYLEYLQKMRPTELASGSNVIGNNIIDFSAKVEKNCRIGPNVIIGPNATIGKGTYLSNCVIMKDSTVKAYSYITSSIVGINCHIGSWVRIESNAVLGEDVNVSDEIYINGCKILPHKTITSLPNPNEIVM